MSRAQRTELVLRSAWNALVVFLFLFPFAIVLLHIADWQLQVFDHEFIRISSNTLKQALCSTFLAGVLGVLGAMGLCGIRSRRWRLIADVIMLLPAVVPSMYIVLSVFRIGEIFGQSVLGLSGIIIGHIITYTGLVAVFFARIIENQLSVLSALSAVEGAGQPQFLRAAWPVVKRDFFAIILTVFFACVMSFSLPIVLGGGERFSLEILVYELMLMKGDLGGVWAVAFVQMAVLFIFSLLLKNREMVLRPSEERLHILGAPYIGLGAVLVTSLVLLIGFKGVLSGKTDLVFHARLIGPEILTAVTGTIYLLCFVALISEAILFCIGYFYPAKFARHFLVGFVGVSPALTGAAMLLQTNRALDSNLQLIFVLAVGIFIFTFPSIYRLSCESFFSSIKSQYDQAVVMGASRLQIQKFIIAPQLRKKSAMRILLLSLWVTGDYAFSSMVAGKPATLGLLGYQYLGGYYLEAAEIVLLVILVIPILATAVAVFAGAMEDRFRSWSGGLSV